MDFCNINQVNEKGVVIIGVCLMIMTAMFLFTAATLVRVVVGQKSVGIELNTKKALYVAEAGITRALWKLDEDSDNDWSNGSPADFNGSLAGGTYAVVFNSSDKDSVQIQSTGTVQEKSRILRVKVKR